MKNLPSLPCALLLLGSAAFSQVRYPVNQGDNLLRLQLINYSDQELADLRVRFATERPPWLTSASNALRNLALDQLGDGLPRSVLFFDLPFQVNSSSFNDSPVTLELVQGGQVMGTFKVRLVSSDLGGSTSLAKGQSEVPVSELESSAAEEPHLAVPTGFALSQNYPNPFNPATVISYSLPVYSYVRLKVFNVLGQELATLVDEMQDAGFKTVRFEGRGLPSGVYIYRLTTQNFVSTKKMIVVR